MDTWNEMIWLEEQSTVRAEHTTMVGGHTEDAKDTSYEEGRDVKRGHVSSFWALLVFFVWLESSRSETGGTVEEPDPTGQPT